MLQLQRSKAHRGVLPAQERGIMAQSKELIYIPLKTEDLPTQPINPNDPVYPAMMIMFEDDSEDGWGANTATH